jgi:DNA-binding transcriptional LysR family regulator
MHIHSRALKYFDMIRRCGSIREAARRLHVSSSAVNRQLLQLEGEVGSPLFERLPSGLLLTPAGEILSRHVVTVLQDAQRMSSELDALKGIRRGAVDVVSVEALTSAFLPAVLEAMITRYPAVQLSVRIAGSASAALAVVNGEADVALGFVLQRSESLRQLAVGRFSLGAIVAPGHPLATSAQVSFAECARYPLVLPSQELSIHWEIKSLVASHRKPKTVVLETGSLELMKELAARGVGVAFVNRFGIERELKQGLLRHVRLKGQSPSNLGAYVRAGRSLPPAVDAFARIVAEEIERREAEEP